MSEAEELLEKLTEDDLDPTTEEHIIIGKDRFVTVPEALQRIAVQYDHNVETVRFDCPRYWDDHDLSTMYICINFLRSDGFKGTFLAKNIVVDETDPNMFHFDWTIGQELTMVEGEIKFLVCAMIVDSEGSQEIHWNSEINEQMFVSTGLEAQDDVAERYPEIIIDLLSRMDTLIAADSTILDTSLSQTGFAADAGAVGTRFDTVNESINNTNKRIDDFVANNMEEDPTVPAWAKEPEKPTYSHDELSDGDTIAIKNGVLQTGLNAEMIGGKTLENLTDIGEIRVFSNSATRTNYLLCNGATIQSEDYPDLHSKLQRSIFNELIDAGVLPTFMNSGIASPLFKIGSQYIAMGKYDSNYARVYYSTDLQTWTQGHSSASGSSGAYDNYRKQIGNKVYAIGRSGTASDGYPNITIITNGTTVTEKTGINGGTVDKGSQLFSIDGNGNNIVVLGNKSDGSGFGGYSTDGGTTWKASVVPAAVVSGDALAYHNGGFYAANTTSAGYLQYSSDNGANFGNYKTNISGKIENVYSVNGKLVVKINGGYLYVGTTYDDLVLINTLSYGIDKIRIVNDKLYAVWNDNIYEVDVINDTKILICGYKEYYDKVETIYVENNYAYVVDDGKYKKTDVNGALLPEITNSRQTGYHYIRAK